MFDLERLKAKLAERITSIDAFVTLLKECSTGSYVMDYIPHKNDAGRWQGSFHRYLVTDSPMPHTAEAIKQLGPNSSTIPSRWWMVREAMRVAVGQRTTLHEVLDYDPALAAVFDGLFAYISATDPTKIAFTASIEDGERDKQTVASIGRFGRVVQAGWRFGDDKFRDAETALRAEASSNLEILTGAAIEEAWQIGPESCMTESCFRASGGGYWERSKTGVHPVMVYDAPGWGVAVIRNGEKISQRAVVYVDAATGDKSYIRVYGTGPLERRLRRNGYVNRVPYGAKLKLIPAAIGGDYVVVPYLDGRGGMNDGNGVCIDDGWLKVIDAETVRKYRKANVQYASQGATHAFVELVQPDLNPWTSLFGATADAFATKHPAATVIDGAIVMGYVTDNELVHNQMYEMYVPNGDSRTRRVPLSESMTLGGRSWIKHIDSLAAAEYVEIAEADVPAITTNKPGYRGTRVHEFFDKKWAPRSAMHELADGRLVPLATMSDLITMKDGLITTDMIHESQLKRGVHKKIRTFRGRPTYVTDDVPTVVVERGHKGFKSVVGVHEDIAVSTSGVPCFRADMVRWEILGATYDFAPSEMTTNAVGRDVPRTLPPVAQKWVSDWVDQRLGPHQALGLDAQSAWERVYAAACRMHPGYDLRWRHDIPTGASSVSLGMEAYAKLKSKLADINNPALTLLVQLIDERLPTLFVTPPVEVTPVEVEPVETNILTLAA